MIQDNCLTYNIEYPIYKMAYINKKVLNNILYIDYIALAIVPFLAQQLLDSY